MNDSSPLPTQYLPESLRRIAEYCGWEVMWAIWGEYAGGRLAVPKTLEVDHPLCQLLGPMAARQFCELFGGNLIVIAKADAAKRAIRDRALRAERKNGVSMNRLCKQYDLTYRQIQTICRENPGDPAVSASQMSFDFFN